MFCCWRVSFLFGAGFEEPLSIEEATLVMEPEIFPPEVVVLLTIFRDFKPLLIVAGY
jgi:hypothetical protein